MTEKIDQSLVGRLIQIKLRRSQNTSAESTPSSDTLQGILFAVDPGVGFIVIIQPADNTTSFVNMDQVEDVHVEEKSTNVAHSKVNEKYHCQSAQEFLPRPQFSELRKRLRKALSMRRIPTPQLSSKEDSPSTSSYPIASSELLYTLLHHFNEVRWGDNRDFGKLVQLYESHNKNEKSKEILQDPEAIWPILVVMEDILIHGPWDGREEPRICSRNVPFLESRQGEPPVEITEKKSYIVHKSECTVMETILRVRRTVKKWASTNILTNTLRDVL